MASYPSSKAPCSSSIISTGSALFPAPGSSVVSGSRATWTTPGGFGAVVHVHGIFAGSLLPGTVSFAGIPSRERGSSVLCIYAATTMRARIVLIQPHLNATVMKPMFARQHGHLCSQFNRVHTDRTLRFAITVQHFLIHGFLGQRLDRILRGGRRRISVGVVLE